jgi:5-formyltetrahydrofolate cyclo-ligase
MHERKKILRAEMREKLRNFPKEQRARASEQLTEALISSFWWGQAKSVALFSARWDEPDLSALWNRARAEGRNTLFPKVAGEHLEFYQVNQSHQLREGSFGLLEPDPDFCLCVKAAEVDLVLVPGLAFDRRGFRLGRGKGYYDRFLSQPNFKGRALGLFFDLQEVSEVPTEPHDRALSGIFTERGGREC